ncbi:MAG TPA: Rnf-Nqr domain containing protein, partial [Bacteroidales bacterium]|nr:Rnf-Nqr domain containing protein [Bacteroidales bacterium]
TLVTSLLQKYLLVPFNLTFLQTIVFILVIATLVQMVEIILKKISPPLYQALGIFLPLISTNCAILGIAILVTQKPDFSLLDSTLYAIFTAIGYTVAIVIFAGLREQLSLVKVPKKLDGVPIALIISGILAMAFMGFANLV